MSEDADAYAAALSLTYVTPAWVLQEMVANGGVLRESIVTEADARNAALLVAIADAWDAGLASA